MQHLHGSTRARLGEYGEAIAKRYYEGLGYKVTRPDDYHYGDLRLINEHGESIYVEVKATRTRRATIYKKGSQSSEKAHYIHAYVITENGLELYIIPKPLVTTSRIYLSGGSKYGTYQVSPS